MQNSRNMDELAKFQLRLNFRIITLQNFRVLVLKNAGNLEIWENWQNLRKGLGKHAKDHRNFFIDVLIEYKNIGQI